MRIATQQIAVVAEALAISGVDPSPWLLKTGLPALSVMEQPDWRPEADMDAAMRMAQVASDDPGFGLVVATSLAQARHGTLAMLAMQAPTLRAILADIDCFFGLLQERRELSYVVDGSSCVLTFDPLGSSKDGLRFRLEQIMGGMMVLLRHSGANDADPPRAAFAHKAPVYAKRYISLFGQSVTFGQPKSTLTFPSALLDAAQAHRDATSYALVRARAQAELFAISGQNSIAGAVRQLLERNKEGVPTMGQAATSMGISARTLRRRLVAEGLTYGRLLQEHRRSAAQRSLQQGSMPLKMIATHLGYGSVSSFHRAFKLHSSMTPAQWQKVQLESALGFQETS